jgi:predicted nucleotidyltransferase
MAKKTNLDLLDIKNKLNELKSVLRRKFRVKKIGIFGSFLKSQQNDKSDLDVLVEFIEPTDFFTFITLEKFLSRRLGVKVDLVMKSALKERIREKVIKETLYV